MTDAPDMTIIELTADIVSAHVGNNSVSPADLPTLIASVHAALARTGAPVEHEPAKLEPAVPIRSSVKHDYIVCLEDGKKLKMLKRYLRTNYDMTPEQYRTKWGLPRDYPMVAPDYADQRRTLAKTIGLGRKPKDVVETVAAPVRKAGKALSAVAAKAAAKAHLGGDKPAPVKRGRPKRVETQQEASQPVTDPQAE